MAGTIFKKPLASIFRANSRPRVVEPPPAATAEEVAAGLAAATNEPLSDAERDARADAVLLADELVTVTDPADEEPSKKRAKKEPVLAELPKPLYANTTLEVVTRHAHELMSTLDAFGTLGNDIALDFHPTTGLHVRQLHADRTCVFDLTMPVSSFASWKVSKPTSFLLFYKQVSTFRKTTKKGDVLSLFEAPKKHAERLCARLFSAASDNTRLFHLRDPSNLDDQFDLPYRDWQFPWVVTMRKLIFAEFVKSCVDAGATTVEWSIDDDDKFLWRTFSNLVGNNSETQICRLTIESIERGSEKPVRQQFSLAFLKTIAAAGSIATSIRLHFGIANHPLRASFQVGDGLFQIDCILCATHVDADDAEEPK
jgi:hypothetical protein